MENPKSDSAAATTVTTPPRQKRDRLALYDSAQEIITTPSGRVWVAAEKHQAVLDQREATIQRLREALEKMPCFCGNALPDNDTHLSECPQQIAREVLDATKP